MRRSEAATDPHGFDPLRVDACGDPSELQILELQVLETDLVFNLQAVAAASSSPTLTPTLTSSNSSSSSAKNSSS
jgi:hypothetical protein